MAELFHGNGHVIILAKQIKLRERDVVQSRLSSDIFVLVGNGKKREPDMLGKTEK